tara:strand:- start:7589 stop:8467 length:879 start_codon:yes stop_codon:yes gene_type:complete
MAQTHVRALDSQNVFGAPLDDGVVVTAGDLIYYDTSDAEFKLADADAVASAATYIAAHGQTGDGTNVARLHGVKRAEIYDEDAPFTAGSAIYLDVDTSSNLITDAARNLTHTAPTGVSDLVQKVGEAITTKRAVIDLGGFGSEVEVVGQEALLENSAARLIVDAGPAAGRVLAATGDDITWHVAIPENAVAIVRGRIQYSCDVTLDTSDTVSWSVASSDVGLANDVVTDSISAAGAAVTADEVAEIDLASGLNAASIVKPGGSLFIKATKAGEGSGNDDHIFFDPVVTFKVV